MDAPTTHPHKVAFLIGQKAGRKHTPLEAAVAEAAEFIGDTHWSDDVAETVRAAFAWQSAKMV